MNIYKISQSTNNGYDTFDSAIVIAKDESEARFIYPGSFDMKWPKEHIFNEWCELPEQVIVEYIGKAKPKSKKCVILASYNSG